ncbi:Stealth CR1 domain-containing protein [Phaeobacter sp. 11ANDIMAR09]|uniref:Stealth CR1 domain-containing protein n=1 Tax=Phaeobacter sp. 11ANDIMAR09 TaxID=1225647 RepID=UPI0009FA2A9D|nr:Stealth CR1 domain-containing protein [Phaeobacter sp. 11ANDIMAR09]
MQTNLINAETRTDNPIDAVITWVDGSSENHYRRRSRYMAQAHHPLHENASNPHRWACNGFVAQIACGDSSRESRMIARGHEQLGPYKIQDQELVGLQ